MKNLIIPALLACAFAGAAFAQTVPAPAPDAASSAPAVQSPAPAAGAPAANAPATGPAAASGSAAAVPAENATASGAPAASAPTAGTPAASTPEATQPSFMEQEIEAAAAELSSAQVGTMTVDDLEKIAAHLAIAVQKERYVERIRNASFMLPGVGQFMAGDTLGGWLFVAWDVTVLAGTIVSAYFVLPANVQFGSLNYLASPVSAIQTAWGSNSLLAYLPLAGVIAGGVILETVLRYVSADNAARTARRNIADGKVTFKPTLELLDGSLGLGMRMQF